MRRVEKGLCRLAEHSSAGLSSALCMKPSCPCLPPPPHHSTELKPQAPMTHSPGGGGQRRRPRLTTTTDRHPADTSPCSGCFWVWRGPSAGSGNCCVGLLSWKLEKRSWRGWPWHAKRASVEVAQACGSLEQPLGQKWEGRGRRAGSSHMLLSALALAPKKTLEVLPLAPSPSTIRSLIHSFAK